MHARGERVAPNESVYSDIEKDDYRLVPLTKGLFARVSPCDFERVSQHKWCASRESRDTKWYAIRWAKKSDPEYVKGKNIKIRMHRWVLGLPAKWNVQNDLVVDHRNHDSLDNRRENLEIITQEENMRRSNGWKKKREEPCL